MVMLIFQEFLKDHMTLLFQKNKHSDMFTNWPHRITQSDPSKQKYAIICYIYNKNWCRHARKMIIILFSTFFG